MPRRPELSVECFRHHWRHVHADLVRQLTYVRRYIQSYPLHDLPGTSPLPYDGIAELWYEDVAAVARAATDPGYLTGARRDEPTFIDMTGHRLLVTYERVLLARPALSSEPSGVKAIVFTTGSGDESSDGWSRLPGARRVVEARVLDAAASPYDRVLELWWDTEDAFQSDWDGVVRELVEGRMCTGSRVTEVRIM
jgi:uncharacterized protein (TIGR02118 family)